MARRLRTLRRELGLAADRLRTIERRLASIQAEVETRVPAWPAGEDYDEAMATDEAVELAHDLEHVLVAYLRPAAAALDRAAGAHKG